MDLFYFTRIQNQRFHCNTDTSILKGYEKVVWDMAGRDVQTEGAVEEHI